MGGERGEGKSGWVRGGEEEGGGGRDGGEGRGGVGGEGVEWLRGSNLTGLRGKPLLSSASIERNSTLRSSHAVRRQEVAVEGSPECCERQFERQVDVPGPSRVSDFPERPLTAVVLNHRRCVGAVYQG